MNNSIQDIFYNYKEFPNIMNSVRIAEDDDDGGDDGNGQEFEEDNDPARNILSVSNSEFTGLVHSILISNHTSM